MRESSSHPGSLAARVARWLAELLLVFLGAYAAFWLNGFQQRQQENKRKEQILASLIEYMQLHVNNSEENAAAWDKRAADFERALNAGEMPAVRPVMWKTDYSPTDIGNFLQAGGLELLDVKTLTAMREADSITRAGLSEVLHDEKISDELIVPNMAKDISFFYDTTTKQLRPPFDGYPASLRSYADFFRRMAEAYKNVLQQLQAEQHR